MKRDDPNQQFSPITNMDHESGVKYQSRVLAFKNGVLYIELTLDRNIKYDKTHREMAIQSAVYYRNAECGFGTALAAKISIFSVQDEVADHPDESPQVSLDSSIGIMYQDGVLN